MSEINFEVNVSETIKEAKGLETFKETDSLLSLIPRTVKAALFDLRVWILIQEAKFSEMEQLVSKKLSDKDPQFITPPEPYVAVPALQALSYSMENEVLKDLYANLLSKAMYVETKSLVHPSFVEIIKQMSPIDALLLKEISKKILLPTLVIMKKTDDNNGEIKISTKITELKIEGASYQIIDVSLSNLDRLGLIDTTNDRHYTDDKVYEFLESYPDVELLIQQHIEADKSAASQLDIDTIKKRFEKRKGLIEVTPLGRAFIDVCI